MWDNKNTLAMFWGIQGYFFKSFMHFCLWSDIEVYNRMLTNKINSERRVVLGDSNMNVQNNTYN